MNFDIVINTVGSSASDEITTFGKKGTSFTMFLRITDLSDPPVAQVELISGYLD